MATNAEDTAVDDSKEVTEDDLRDLKYGNGEVETSEEADETDESEDDTNDESEEAGEEAESDQAEEEAEAPKFVKKFPYIKGDTPEEYAQNLEAAYDNSTAEFKRLRDAQVDTTDKADKEEEVDLDPNALYIKQLRDTEITTAFSEITKHYPQVNDQTEYAKFVNTVGVLSNTILQSEKRLAPPKELYSKAAVILGWEPEGKVDDKDKLGNALKNQAAESKNPVTAKPKSKQSKVTDKQVAIARVTWARPGMTDTEIREELEAYV